MEPSCRGHTSVCLLCGHSVTLDSVGHCGLSHLLGVESWMVNLFPKPLNLVGLTGRHHVMDPFLNQSRTCRYESHMPSVDAISAEEKWALPPQPACLTAAQSQGSVAGRQAAESACWLCNRERSLTERHLKRTLYTVENWVFYFRMIYIFNKWFF